MEIHPAIAEDLNPSSIGLSAAEALEALDLVSDGFLLLDSDLRFLYVNRVAEKLSGKTRETLIGRRLLDEFPALRNTRLAAAYLRAVESGVPTDVQAEAPSGRLYDVHIRVAAAGIYVTFRDVTERKDSETALRSALESEQSARISAEAAREESKRRQEAEHFLTEAGRVLASSLDYETTLRSMARLAVPRLADWCVIHMMDEQGVVRRLALEHHDPQTLQWARELEDPYPPDPGAPLGAGRVLRTGVPEIISEITDDILVAAARTDEHLAILRKAGLTSAMVVPLAARERVFGVLSLLSTEQGRRYTEEDLHLAERLARRAAMAVDNALLFRAAQQEITERTRAQEALRESEQRFRAAAEGSFDSFFILKSVRDEAGEIVDFEFTDLNSRGEHLLGVPRERLIGGRLCEILPQDKTDGSFERYRTVVETGRAVEEELGSFAGREDIWLHQQVVPLGDGIAITCRDVTERRKTEQALQKSEYLYRTLTNTVSQLIWQNNAQGQPVYFNERWEQYTGDKVFERSVVDWLRYVYPQDRQSVQREREQGLASGRAFELQCRLRRFDGEWRWHMVRVVPMQDLRGEIEGWIGTAVDIHEMQLLMEQLTTRQMEVENLNDQLRRAMTETHHRVKNNLQIMAAMIDMQVMDADQTVSVNELRRLNRHIRTLAVIHDLLTQKAREDGRAEELSARAILIQLLPMLQQTSGVQAIDFSAEDAVLASRQGTSLALVANELVSNALKHGNQQIQVHFFVKEGTAALEVRDDGPGFPPGFDPSAQANTGLELVENLSRWDLDGRASYINLPDGGACVRVEFPVRT